MNKIPDSSAFHPLLIEGMVAIRGLLEGRLGEANHDAALMVAEAMHNLVPNSVPLGFAARALRQLRETYPEIARQWLPQTFAWLETESDL